mgnify:CR=1 FL=1
MKFASAFSSTVTFDGDGETFFCRINIEQLGGEFRFDDRTEPVFDTFGWKYYGVSHNLKKLPSQSKAVAKEERIWNPLYQYCLTFGNSREPDAPPRRKRGKNRWWKGEREKEKSPTRGNKEKREGGGKIASKEEEEREVDGETALSCEVTSSGGRGGYASRVASDVLFFPQVAPAGNRYRSRE